MKRQLTIVLLCLSLLTGMAYGMDSEELSLLARLDSVAYDTTDLKETDVSGFPAKLQKFLRIDEDKIELWVGSKRLASSRDQRSDASNIVLATVSALEKHGESGDILPAEGDEKGTWGINLAKLPLPIKSRLRELENPSFAQDVLLPTAKCAGLIAVGYLLCKYCGEASNQSN